MPVRRSLTAVYDNHPPASKIPVPGRNRTTLTGAAISRAGKTKATAHEEEEPQIELKKLDSLRSKLEQSVDAFIRAREELEEIFAAEGSSEQDYFITGSSADLKTELKKHRELTSRLASSSKGNKEPNDHSQGPVKMGSSYEFLKSIMG